MLSQAAQAQMRFLRSEMIYPLVIEVKIKFIIILQNFDHGTILFIGVTHNELLYHPDNPQLTSLFIMKTQIQKSIETDWLIPHAKQPKPPPFNFLHLSRRNNENAPAPRSRVISTTPFYSSSVATLSFPVGAPPSIIIILALYVRPRIYYITAVAGWM